MRLKTLSVNYNHHREAIGQNYFNYLDIFHKAFLVALIHATTEEVPLLATSMLENVYYGNMLQEFVAAHHRGEDIIKAIDPDVGVSILLDIQIYLNEFLEKAHNFKTFNIYALTVDEKYNLVITNKQFTRHVV